MNMFSQPLVLKPLLKLLLFFFIIIFIMVILIFQVIIKDLQEDHILNQYCQLNFEFNATNKGENNTAINILFDSTDITIDFKTILVLFRRHILHLNN